MALQLLRWAKARCVYSVCGGISPILYPIHQGIHECGGPPELITMVTEVHPLYLDGVLASFPSFQQTPNILTL